VLTMAVAGAEKKAESGERKAESRSPGGISRAERQAMRRPRSAGSACQPVSEVSNAEESRGNILRPFRRDLQREQKTALTVRLHLLCGQLVARCTVLGEKMAGLSVWNGGRAGGFHRQPDGFLRRGGGRGPAG